MTEGDQTSAVQTRGDMYVFPFRSSIWQSNAIVQVPFGRRLRRSPIHKPYVVPFSHVPVPITDTSQCMLSRHHDNGDPAQAARRLSTKECRVSSWGLISNDDLGSQRRLACDIGEPAIRALCTQDCLDSPLQYPIKGKIT